MYYTPHILERRVQTQGYDDNGHMLKPTFVWEYICRCRCDSNSDKVIVSENGETARPDYHVVCEGRINIANGDFIRCLQADGSLRGEGVVKNRKMLNYLDYTELWM